MTTFWLYIWKGSFLLSFLIEMVGGIHKTPMGLSYRTTPSIAHWPIPVDTAWFCQFLFLGVGELSTLELIAGLH